jgi:molybdopterin-guanine dinucleotide biosynthesis protein A
LQNRTAIILVGGISKRFGVDKVFTKIRDKPLISYILSAIKDIVQEKIIVCSEEQEKILNRMVESNIKILVQSKGERFPLKGARIGFQESGGEYSILLPCDTPFVSSEVLIYLFSKCRNKSAAIPQWSNGYIEPLQAVYKTEITNLTIKQTFLQQKKRLFDMINLLPNVYYVPIKEIQRINPSLDTFLNINTMRDLFQVQNILN